MPIHFVHFHCFSSDTVPCTGEKNTSGIFLPILQVGTIRGAGHDTNTKKSWFSTELFPIGHKINTIALKVYFFLFFYFFEILSKIGR